MKIKHPKSEEFEARQLCLDFFGRAARIVLPIIVKLNKDLRAWEKPARIVRMAISEWVLPLFGDNKSAPGASD